MQRQNVIQSIEIIRINKHRFSSTKLFNKLITLLYEALCDNPNYNKINKIININKNAFSDTEFSLLSDLHIDKKIIFNNIWNKIYELYEVNNSKLNIVSFIDTMIDVNKDLLLETNPLLIHLLVKYYPNKYCYANKCEIKSTISNINEMEQEEIIKNYKILLEIQKNLNKKQDKVIVFIAIYDFSCKNYNFLVVNDEIMQTVKNKFTSITSDISDMNAINDFFEKYNYDKETINKWKTIFL